MGARLVQFAVSPRATEVPLFERFMVPAVPLKLVNVIDEFLLPPVLMIRLFGLTERVKLSLRTVIRTVSVIELTLPELSVV